MKNNKIKYIIWSGCFHIAVGILQIILITLKLAGVISATWFVVMLPTIIPIGLLFLYLFVIYMIVTIILALKE